MSKLLKKPQVARLLQLSTRTVDRLRAAGKLPSFKLGRAVRFREDDVEKMLRRAKN